MSTIRESLHDAMNSLDQAPCGLLTTDARGLLLHANLTFCEWVGRPPDTLLGKLRLQDLLSMGGRIFHQTHWAPLLERQGSISEVRLEVIRPDGSVVPMVMNAILRKRNGVLVQDVAVFVANDRDKYERELLAAKSRLEHLVEEEKRLSAQIRDRALFAEQMVGIVSHDLRNPLTAIHAGVATLQRTEPSERQARVLEKVLRSTCRANRLVADLLDFTLARIGPGIAVNRRRMELHDAISEAVGDLALVFPERELRHVASGSGVCLGDADRLVQVVGNLVSNAVAYGFPDGAIVVTSTVEDASFSVAVHNHGQAIAPEALQRLFQPMVRGAARGGEATSIGLGLFIVGEIVQAHGGTVTVESSDESGTTFTAEFVRD